LAEPPASSPPATDGGQAAPPGLEQTEGEFRDLLDRVKLLGPVVIPLRGESDLLRRMSSNLTGARRFVDRVSVETLETLGLQLFGLLLAVVAILIGAVLWRVAANRYLQNTYHRRLALATRNVVVACAIALVVVFHFTSELTALVTALGFAAAGIAFALQNVILSVAGYFSMVAPNGIRVGDRVSLQGPFGFVHGDVLDIGLVRIRLLELGGEDNKPTGRTVVFPNAVVFTGSFYKENATPPAAAR
jgi:small-conductance mechanosensitive channel